MKKTYLSMEEVAVAVGVSRQTIYNWYRFKAENPDCEYVKFLPDTITGPRRKKLWDKSDINNLIQFKKIVPKGRNGIMGDVTQRYIHKPCN